MKHFIRAAVLVTVLLGLAVPATAQDSTQSAAPSQAEIDRALDNAMTPGEGQKRLDAMIGTFEVAVSTWTSPSADPIEDTMTAHTAWILGNRYVEMKIEGSIAGEPFNGAGYYGFDNVSKEYQAAWMDTGSTGITWYTGGFDAAGTHAIMRASVPDLLTGEPTPQELRITVGENGDRVTEMWGTGFGDTMFKMMELRFTRRK